MGGRTPSDRFLIVRLGSLGDVVHGVPAAAALRRRYPDARIDWLVDPRYVELLGLVTAIDERIGLDARAGAGALVSTVRALRRRRYRAAIDLQGLLKSAVLARAAGAELTVGFPRAHLREPAACMFYSAAPDPGPAPHVVQKNLALLGALDVSDRRVEFPLRIPRTAAVEAVERATGGQPYALINPGAAWPNKRWPPDRFGSLASGLRDRIGLRSLVLWGPGEEELARAVVSASARAAVLSPPAAIPDLAGIARGARVMVSGDTGPLHVAAAVGTPVVALFGPTRAERNGPWSPGDEVVSRTAECGCLYARRCRRRVPCIDGIGVPEVLAAVERRLQPVVTGR